MLQRGGGYLPSGRCSHSFQSCKQRGLEVHFSHKRESSNEQIHKTKFDSAADINLWPDDGRVRHGIKHLMAMFAKQTRPGTAQRSWWTEAPEP